LTKHAKLLLLYYTHAIIVTVTENKLKYPDNILDYLVT
jgi:hypothetical protein